MKIGLVSPYDWSYPGGVQDHIAHLAAELRARGHTVRILTPATGPRARQVEYGVYKLGWAAPVRVNGSVARVAVAPDWRGRIRNSAASASTSTCCTCTSRSPPRCR